MSNPIPKDNSDIYELLEYPILKKEKLNRVFKPEQKDFLKVLFERRSDSNHRLTKSLDISELLFYSSKIKFLSSDQKGFIISKRTAPSAGGRHPIDILVSPPGSLNQRNLFYYNPIDHSLNELNLPAKRMKQFLSEVDKNLRIDSSFLLWFSIQTFKTSSKYLNPESLYWRDAGALLAILQLVGTFLGYKTCPIGTLAENKFKKLFEGYELISGGGIIVGK